MVSAAVGRVGVAVRSSGGAAMMRVVRTVVAGGPQALPLDGMRCMSTVYSKSHEYPIKVGVCLCAAALSPFDGTVIPSAFPGERILFFSFWKNPNVILQCSEYDSPQSLVTVIARVRWPLALYSLRGELFFFAEPLLYPGGNLPAAGRQKHAHTAVFSYTHDNARHNNSDTRW